jgi:hypothetical protein
MEIGQRLAPGTSQQPRSAAGETNGASDPINELDLKLKVAEALDRPPSTSLAVVLVRDGYTASRTLNRRSRSWRTRCSGSGRSPRRSPRSR